MKYLHRFLLLLTSFISLSVSLVTAETITNRTLISAESANIAHLKEFLTCLLSSTECGYVLYGQKPVCFIGMFAPGDDLVGKVGHYRSIAILNGMKAWKALNLPKETDNFILLMKDAHALDWPYILMINRHEFHKAVNDNRDLFRYILGNKITSKKLLEKIMEPEEDFFSLLKDNKVLLGILLGFGKNNALLVNRKELITEWFDNDHTMTSVIEPSFGYQSLEEELADLDDRISLSSSSLVRESPELYFGCLAESEESKKLIKHYEEVQLKIIEVLDSKDSLNLILSQFYSRPNHTFYPLRRNTLPNGLTKFNDEKENGSHLYRAPPYDISAIVAHAIKNQYSWFINEEDKEESILAFIEGLYAADRMEDSFYYSVYGDNDLWSDFTRAKQVRHEGLRIWSHYKYGQPFYSLDRIIQLFQESHPTSLTAEEKKRSYSLLNQLHTYIYQQQQSVENEKADKFFSALPKGLMKNEGMYYQPLIHGTGEKIDASDSIEVLYTIRCSSGHILRGSVDEVEKIDLRRTLPALKICLDGLRVGSKGVVYIHPKYGFRENGMLLYLKPFLFAEIEIVSVDRSGLR